MAQNYFGNAMHSLDRDYYNRYSHQLDNFGPVQHPLGIHEQDGGARTGLTPREVGSTVNPMINQIAALQAKIREGASRLEIGFGGVGKGNAQMATPEAYGEVDRETLRQLAEYNDVKTSTHASFQLAGLAGFGREGFSKQQQQVILEEVKKAVDFASQATTGGAVVVHTGEWQRPISEAPWATQDFKNKFGDKAAYSGYLEEEKKAIIPVVDSRTGEIVSGIRKDQELFEPEWMTVENYEKYTGRKLTGKYANGRPADLSKLSKYEYVDGAGNVIDSNDPIQAELRTPHYDSEKGVFKTKKITWNDILARTNEYNRTHNDNKSPEEIFAITRFENKIFEGKANKYFYGDVETLSREASYLEEQARQLRDDASKDERAALELRKIELRMQELNERMRRAVQTQSSADVQEAEIKQLIGNIQTMENYGLKQSGAALANVGIHAMEKSRLMLEEVKKRGGDTSKYEKIYIAPENVFTEQYGSHPDEMIKIIQAGRDQMVKELTEKHHKSEEEARQLAKEHIKSTVDIGHLNMWKKHMERIPGETDEQFHKRFEKWTLEKLETMHKKGMLGHFHLTDNLGYNDEHLTPGQGNAPIQAFVKKLAEWGYKDFIAEIGSFNAGTILGDTWTHLGVEHFNRGSPFAGAQFRDLHSRHFGGYAPPNFVLSTYIPSNDFTLWSGVPLE